MSARPKRIVATKRKPVVDISSDDEAIPSTSKRSKLAKDPKLLKKSVAKKKILKEKLPEKESTKNEKSSRKKEDIRSEINAKGSSQSSYLIPSEKCEERPWSIEDLLAEKENISSEASKNIVYLLENDNTIPFICRYRRDLIDPNVTPEKLRDIKNTYTEILILQKRADTIIKQLDKENVSEKKIHSEILAAKSIEELEFLYAPYKPASKGTLADRAKALGLDKYAEEIIYGKTKVLDLSSLIDKKNDKLNSIDKIEEGIMHVISYIISKNSYVLEQFRKMQNTHRIVLKSSKVTSKNKENSNDKNVEQKYELYFNFECPIAYIKPHQILAFNRGEKLKILQIKLNIPEAVKYEMKNFCRKLFLSKGFHNSLRNELFEKSYEDCYNKKLQPLLTRQIRSNLNEIAKKASIEVFARNLKQLLLMSPLKGEKILGIDPGFSNGCKLALISEVAELLETAVIYPHNKHRDPNKDAETLIKMLTKYNCKIVALGNGTACRETECWLSRLFQKGLLDSAIVRYSIVSEVGASIYSCTDIAKKEFPNLDINLISAVSIARRLNDPLSEYVKIEPKHLGVGMYQHDINEKNLSESLNEVVSECVSFVGIDINTASISVLKHIAGLTESRAQKIIEYRVENGPYKTRKDLLKVKTIGEKTFVQCAGFIRIEAKSVGGEIKNLLDTTWVHPESYDVAIKIISRCNLNLKDIGTPDFISKIKSFSTVSAVENFSTEFRIPKERIHIIIEALQRKLFQDYRVDINKQPLFKQGIMSMHDLKKGILVSGAVTNITHFGAFVDIGCEHDALIHTSKMNGSILNIGDRVEVTVLDVDVKRKRIQLKFENICM